MKQPAFRPVHKKKEPTTNYVADTHMEFCVRCSKRNGRRFCPRSKNGGISMRECSL